MQRPSGRLRHHRNFMIAHIRSNAGQLHNPNLVEDINVIHMVFVEHELQVLAVRVNVDSLQLSRLVIRLNVIVQTKMAKALEGYAWVVDGQP